MLAITNLTCEDQVPVITNQRSLRTKFLSYMGIGKDDTHFVVPTTRSATETLQGEDKFFCNACGTYQEATKRTRLVSLPDVLLLHLSRFKYTTTQDRCAGARQGTIQGLRRAWLGS